MGIIVPGNCIILFIRRRRLMLYVVTLLILLWCLTGMKQGWEATVNFEISANILSSFRSANGPLQALSVNKYPGLLIRDPDMTNVNDSDCVPPEVLHLPTAYTARLCRGVKWLDSGNEDTAGMTCQYPSMNPFNRIIAQHFKLKNYRGCGLPKYPRLFSSDLDYLITVKDPALYGYSNCCYLHFQRRPLTDSGPIVFKRCHPITSKRQKIPSRHEFIKIICDAIPSLVNKTHKTRDNSNEYIEYMAFVPQRPSLKKNFQSVRQRDFDSVNVILLGIDSMSHMNFIRTMPLSYEYITNDLKGFGMNGYNKVGDNTFGNLVPLLTGMFPDQISARPKNGCPVWAGPYDKCPFIWHRYAAEGYTTVYGEDSAHVTMFNYMRRGFIQPPTHYYLRPLIYLSDGTFKRNQSIVDCYAGPKLHFQYLLDYMKSVAARMGNEHRYFELLWENSLTHHHISLAQHGDIPLRETLAWFKNNGYLNNTVLVVLSDHGMRYLGFRDSLQGRYEDRMPFLFFLLPPWFHSKYPSAVKNLMGNKHRLTSAFDVHHTLADLLRMDSLEDQEIFRRTKGDMKIKFQNRSRRHWLVRRHGMSLFLPVPKTRICPDAGIPDLFCICHRFEAIDPQGAEAKRAARYLIQNIDGRLKRYPMCRRLFLQQIVKAHRLVIPSKQLNLKNEVTASSHLKGQSAKDYIQQTLKESYVTTVIITVNPGNSSFEGSVRRNDKGNMYLWGDINRITMYGNQSHCVKKYNMKPFCFCRN